MVFCYSNSCRLWYQEMGCCCNKYLKVWPWFQNWWMGGGWRNLRHRLETWNVRGNSGDCSERKEESWRERFSQRIFLGNTSIITNRMLVEIQTVKVSYGNKKQVIGDWRKGNPCYKFPNNLADLCSSVLWKVELLMDEISFCSYLLLYRERHWICILPLYPVTLPNSLF